MISAGIIVLANGSDSVIPFFGAVGALLIVGGAGWLIKLSNDRDRALSTAYAPPGTDVLPEKQQSQFSWVAALQKQAFVCRESRALFVSFWHLTAWLLISMLLAVISLALLLTASSATAAVPVAGWLLTGAVSFVTVVVYNRRQDELRAFWHEQPDKLKTQYYEVTMPSTWYDHEDSALIVLAGGFLLFAVFALLELYVII